MNPVSFLNKINPRLLFAIIFLASSGALGVAFYAQLVNHADPCPLCIAQRIIYAAIGLIAFLATIFGTSKTSSCLYAIITGGVSIFGIKTAYHHVWLQSLPPSEWPASCGMPLEILYKQVPLSGFLHTVLSGSAECAMVGWKILGMSGAIISLVGFIAITILTLIVLIKSLIKQRV